MRPRPRGRPRNEHVEMECAHCGEKLMLPKWEAKRRKYCSLSCFHASGAPRQSRKQPVEKTCALCGTAFTTSAAASMPGKNARYCSDECRSKATWRQPPPRQLSELEAAWLGGLFEGEGSIVFAKNRPSKNIRMTVANTYYPLIERVMELTATGTILELTRYRKNPNHNPVWNWQCYGENARNLLRQIYPYLLSKKERADIALGRDE